jgi:hypothetical protein
MSVGSEIVLAAPATDVYSFRSPAGGSGIFYSAGFYEAAATAATITQAAPTQNYGTVNVSYAAHIFVVASGAGTTDGSDLVLTVSGTSINDLGTRTPGDSQVIVADCTAASTDEYFETPKKWLGQVTFTLSSTAGSAFSFTCNYGICKYDDRGNRNFTITDIEVVGRAGANDSSFNVGVVYHKSTGWTYHATAFVPGTGFLYDMNTDHNTETNLSNGEFFAWKRAGLSQDILGKLSEGYILQIVTGANNSVSSMNAKIGVIFQ